MNATSDIQKRREEIAVNYFRMVDAGNPAVIDIFAEDAHMFDPKFGIARGSVKKTVPILFRKLVQAADAAVGGL